MKKKLIFVGAGPATLYALMHFNKFDTYEVLVIDKGKPLHERTKKDNLFGFGGAGAFSDYKLVFDPTVSDESLFNLIKGYTFGRGMWLPKKDYNIDISSKGFIDAGNDVLHIGTDLAPEVLQDIYKTLTKKGVVFRFNTEVYNVEGNNVILNNHEKIHADKIYIAVGRTGSGLVGKIFNTTMHTEVLGCIDVGFRVEVPYNDILKDISVTNYDMKLKRNNIRTFCVNHYSAKVVTEKTKERLQANGHSYGLNCDKKHITNKSNFAVLYTFRGNTIKLLEELDKLTNTKIKILTLDNDKIIEKISSNFYIYKDCFTFTRDLCDLLKVDYKDCKIHLPEIKIRNEFSLGNDVVTLIGDCGGTRGIVPSACSGIHAINKL